MRSDTGKRSTSSAITSRAGCDASEPGEPAETMASLPPGNSFSDVLLIWLRAVREPNRFRSSGVASIIASKRLLAVCAPRSLGTAHTIVAGSLHTAQPTTLPALSVLPDCEHPSMTMVCVASSFTASAGSTR